MIAICAGAALWGTTAFAQTADPLAAQLRQGLTPAEVQAIVKVHNDARAAVTEASPALVPVTWNTVLAAQAQAYADVLATGVEGHDPKRGDGWNVGVGENLAGIYMDRLGTAEQLAKTWLREKAANFTYKPFPQSNIDTRGKDAQGNYDGTGDGGSGHYTQVVWDYTTQIGCGASSRLVAQGSGSQVHRILVCRYLRGGNELGAYPYYTVSNKPTMARPVAVEYRWTSATDVQAARTASASDLGASLLPYINGYRTNPKLSWDTTFAADAQAIVDKLAAGPYEAMIGWSQWGYLISFGADDSGYVGAYPDVKDLFDKTTKSVGWMPDALNNAQWSRVGCGTATHDWNAARWRVTVCRFKEPPKT